MDERQYRELKREIRKIETMVMDIYDSVVKEKKICPVCKNKIRLYLPYGLNQRYNAQCPVCRSLERHRALWLFFDNNMQFFSKENMRILHFAPESIFINRFSLNENIEYWPVDINPQVPGIKKTVDITDIPFEDNSMDMIICNHVLEHIPNEDKALRELYRVLNPKGIAILNVPIDRKREVTLENPEYNTPELRLKYYGQTDHVRLYGRDYVEHLKRAFPKVEVIDVNKDYDEWQLKNYGLWKNEQIYLCKKK